MATVDVPRKSTIVPFFGRLQLRGLRMTFCVGGWLLPATTAGRIERLFVQPLASSRQRARAAALEGAQLETLEVDGERIVVYRWGDPATQPVVLFSHGWSSFGLRVQAWLPSLRARGYAVVSFDQIGHGRSSGNRTTLAGFARVLAAVAAHVGPLAGVIGHSLGGAAVGLALAGGMRAQRVVLVAPAADAQAASDRFAGTMRLGRPALAAFHRAIQARAGMSFAAVAMHHLAPALGTPALIVHDLADREVPWEEGERCARYWPGARLLSTLGLGHHRIVGDAGVVAAGLEFLRGDAVGERVVSTDALPYGLA